MTARGKVRRHPPLGWIAVTCASLVVASVGVLGILNATEGWSRAAAILAAWFGVAFTAAGAWVSICAAHDAKHGPRP